MLAGRAALLLLVLAALGAAGPGPVHADPGPCGGTCAPPPPPPPPPPSPDPRSCDDCTSGATKPNQRYVTVYRSTRAYSTPYLNALKSKGLPAAIYPATCEANSGSRGRYSNPWWSRLRDGYWVNNGDLKGPDKTGIGDCPAPPNDGRSRGNPRGQSCDCEPATRPGSEGHGVKHLSGRRRKVVDFMARYAEPPLTTYTKIYGFAHPDCTHFASEALLAAGWPEVGVNQGGHDAERWLDTNQWWRLQEGTPVLAGSAKPKGYPVVSPRRNATYTFTVARYLYKYLGGRAASGHAHRLTDPRDLDYGDLMQVDQERDGRMDHTVVVTGFDARGWPLYSQHSDGVWSRSLWSRMQTRPKYHWFYWHLDDLDR